MKRPFLFLLAVLTFNTALVPAFCNTVIWSGAGGGNWSDSSSWKPKHVPSASDIAVITNAGNYTITVDVAASVGGLILGANDGNTQTLTINGQTFTLAGQATINAGGKVDLSSGTFIGDTNSGGAIYSGTLSPAGGNISGALTFTANSVLNLTTTNIFNGLVFLTNNGTINWSNTDLYGATNLRIYNTGLWNAQSNNTFYGAGTIFTNSGTFRKSAGTGTTTLDTNIVFYSSGTLDTQNGTLAIQAGTCSGIFNAANGTILNFGSSRPFLNFALTGYSTFSGGGLVEGNFAGNNAIISGTVTFSAAIFNGVFTVTNTGTASFSGTLSSNIFWDSSFKNYGTVNWSNVDLYGFGSPSIYNYGLWDAKGSNTFHGTGLSYNYFYNYGTLRKSSGNTTTLDNNLSFENAGTVDVENGTLEIQTVGGYGTGIVNIATNAIANYNGGNGPTTTTIFTGSGSLLGYLNGTSGGSFIINGAITYLGGTISGTLTVATNAVLNFPVGANLSIPSCASLTNFGTVNWISGDLLGSGGGNIYNYGLWDCKTNNTFYGAYNSTGITTFNNFGTFRKSGGTVNDTPFNTSLDPYTTFNNFGTIDVQIGNLSIRTGSGSGAFNIGNNASVDLENFTLTNNPTFSGQGQTGGWFIGTNAVIHGSMNFVYGSFIGSITLATNSTINLDSVWGLPTFNATLFTNYGTVNWDNTDLGGQFSPQIYNYGLWDCKTNNTFYGAYNSTGITTFNNFGTFRKSGGVGGIGNTLLDYNTTLNNSGLIDTQLGQINIVGNYSLTGGTLNFGISSPIDFGSIYLSGNTPLTGTLSVNLANAYSPAASNSFALVNYSSLNGTFTNLNLPHLTSPLFWQTNYSSTAFTLSIGAASPPQLSSTATTTQNGTGFGISWNGIVGLTYQVQCTTNLSPANWVDLGASIPGTNGPITISDIIGLNPQKYYRIVILP